MEIDGLYVVESPRAARRRSSDRLAPVMPFKDLASSLIGAVYPGMRCDSSFPTDLFVGFISFPFTLFHFDAFGALLAAGASVRPSSLLLVCFQRWRRRRGRTCGECWDRSCQGGSCGCQSLVLLESQVYGSVRDSDRGNVGLERGLGYGTRIR